MSDESPGAAGNVKGVELAITGVPIRDTDGDGLDDDWEMARLGTLAYGPKDDPDVDSYSNAREQVMGTDPLAPELLIVDFSKFDARLGRLSWASNTNFIYGVYATTNLSQRLVLETNIAGRFPETEWFAPRTNSMQRFFSIQATRR